MSPKNDFSSFRKESYNSCASPYLNLKEGKLSLSPFLIQKGTPIDERYQNNRMLSIKESPYEESHIDNLRFGNWELIQEPKQKNYLKLYYESKKNTPVNQFQESAFILNTENEQRFTILNDLNPNIDISKGQNFISMDDNFGMLQSMPDNNKKPKNDYLFTTNPFLSNKDDSSETISPDQKKSNQGQLTNVQVKKQDKIENILFLQMKKGINHGNLDNIFTKKVPGQTNLGGFECDELNKGKNNFCIY